MGVIPVWPSLSAESKDPRTHFWYKGSDDSWLRLCDDAAFVRQLRILEHSDLFIPCTACKELYALDIAFGRRLFEVALDPPSWGSSTTKDMVYSLNNGVATQDSREETMLEHPPLGMATLARFYDASGPQKVMIVREARTFWIEPKKYAQRDYYATLRNTLRRTHWATDDLATFSDAREYMVSDLGNPVKKEHYLKLSEAYIDYWAEHDAHYFAVEESRLEVAGLTVLVTPEIGMRRNGDRLALKLWLAAPKPKRPFRQVIQYLMGEAQRRGWATGLQPALWDVRRGEILPPVPIPKDFALAVAGQAVAFLQIWDSLGAVE